MTTETRHAADYISRLLAERNIDDLAARLRPDSSPSPPHVPGGSIISPDAVERRWQVLDSPGVQAELLDAHSIREMKAYERNIENFVGTAKVPVGIAGPLRVRGLFAQGDFYVPLATTEAALIASYSRGAALITEVGGASAMLLNEGISRAPAFAFNSFEELGRFVAWFLGVQIEIKKAAEGTTRFGKLIDTQICIEGNHVYLILVFTTGDAAGQNMASIATEAAVNWILANTPVKPRAAYVEANFSGDKKASAHSLQTVRGKKVTAEVTIPADLVQRRLHTTVGRMIDFAGFATIGGIMSGTLGTQGHYANGLAAMFIACGQDAACVAEAAIGNTRMEKTQRARSMLRSRCRIWLSEASAVEPSFPASGLVSKLWEWRDRVMRERSLRSLQLCAWQERSRLWARFAQGEFIRAHARLARGTREKRVVP